jgi:hypothetical protein
MKNSAFVFSRMLLLLGLGLIPYNVNAQNVKLTRQEKKEIELAEMNANFYAIDTLLARKTFVLEADYLQNQNGNKIPVTSILNFIKVDSTKATLQTGDNNSTGYNGVGGTTAEGDLQSYKVTKDIKRLTHTVRFSVMTNVGIFDVLMFVGADSKARATITGLYGGNLTWEGQFRNLYDSHFFRGRESY